MSISLIVSGLGAILAAIGSGVLLSRCFRAPRGDIIAWSVAMLGLLVSLGSQAIGHLAGFDGAMFRAMELGGQVIAPLALILGLSEVAAKSAAARFCARLYIPALGIVAVVILTLDQLSATAFSKAWPDPAVFYQAPPNYVLTFAIGPVTALVAIIAMATVMIRSGQPGWNAAGPATLLAGGAALAVAYPALAQLTATEAGVHLPVSSLFAILCAVAAGLTLLAGLRTGGLQLGAVRGGATPGRDYPAPAGPGPAGAGYAGYNDRFGGDQTGDFDRFEPATDGGLYRGGGLYRPDADRGYRREDDGDGWQDDRSRGYDDGSGRSSGARDWDDDYNDGLGAARHGDSYPDPDFATGDFVPDGVAAAELAAPGLAGPGRGLDDDFGYPAGGWQSNDQRPDPFGRGPGRAGPDRDLAGRPGPDGDRAQLFGQIAIYTLLEDRVDEFDQLAQRVVEQVRSREPDTLVFIVHAVPSAPMQRILYEVYRDRVAFDRHNQQPHVQHFQADQRPYVLATNVIELGLQQAKVSPFPSVAELFGEPGYDTSGFERPDYLRDYGRTSAQPGGSSREFR
jgi:quinol monooxygenase YgiN